MHNLNYETDKTKKWFERNKTQLSNVEKLFLLQLHNLSQKPVYSVKTQQI